MQCIGPVQGATNDAYVSVLCVQNENDFHENEPEGMKERKKERTK